MKNSLNEKHLADKLQNVPVPDVDQSWEQMRKLLDREMPEPVAVAWSGNRKWWWMGITAAVVMVAVWLGNSFSEGAKQRNVVAEKNANEQSAKAAASNKQPSDKRLPDNKASVKQSLNNQTIDNKNNDQNINSQNINNKTISDQAINDKIINDKTINDQAVNNQIASKQNFATQAETKQSSANKKESFTRHRLYTTTTTTSTSAPANRLPKTQSIPDITPIIVNNNSTEIEPSSINLTIVPAENLLTPAGTFTSLENNQPLHLAVSGKTDRAFAREVRKKTMKEDNRRLSRASMRGNSRDNFHELTFAAGLALPQSFAISGQQAANYNVAAKAGRITDYLPAPYFQYHLNDKVFLQTEFHFQSPQYTQRLLLSQSIDSFLNAKHETSQHLEKLYYFNIPFNIYYSPARNFYIGGGLQYSSLLGGIATYEDKRSVGSNVVSYTSVTTRFKDDSAAAVFRPSEWRYQFDASYYFNRFSLGMRYNQAMKDFINTQVGPAAIIGRNKAFLVYLRFNIWEERKKTND